MHRLLRSALWLASFAQLGSCAPICKHHEPLLRYLLASILSETGIVPTGSIIDAGANDGEDACLLAKAQPRRIVHALDPLQVNVQATRRRCAAECPNIQAELGALGKEAAVIATSRHFKSAGPQAQLTATHKKATQPAGQQSGHGIKFNVSKIDDLFGPFGKWAGELLGLAHLDVEGAELDTLEGGRATIGRDGPLLTLEVLVDPKRPHNDSTGPDLLRAVDAIGYKAFVVEESCGGAHCRNLLCLPCTRASALLASSATLQWAVGAGAITPIHAHAFVEHVLRTNWQGGIRGKACGKGEGAKGVGIPPPTIRMNDTRASGRRVTGYSLHSKLKQL